MMWLRNYSLLFLCILYSIGTIPSTMSDDVDPMLKCIACFVDDVVSDMTTNISDLSNQMSAHYEESVEYQQNTTAQITDFQRNILDISTKTEQTSVQLNEVSETMANHTILIARLEENLDTCLHTSSEQNNAIHQIQQTIQVIQEILDALSPAMIRCSKTS